MKFRVPPNSLHVSGVTPSTALALFKEGSGSSLAVQIKGTVQEALPSEVHMDFELNTRPLMGDET